MPAPILRTNVAPTAWVPAVTGTTTLRRASTASLLSVMLVAGAPFSVAASPPTVIEEDALTVNRDLDLMRVLETADGLEVSAIQRQRELVLGVERERVVDDQAADRAKRQPFDVLILRTVLPDSIGIGSGCDRERRPPAH